MAFLKQEEAFALITVLFFSVVLLILGGTLLTYSLYEREIAGYQQKKVDLYYTAEAGLETGMATLQKDFLYEGALSGNLGEERHFEVSFSEEFVSRRRVTSTGVVGEHSFTTSALMELAAPYNQALLATEKLTLEEVNIHGNLHVNDTLKLKGSNALPGDEENTYIFSYSDANRLQILTDEANFTIIDHDHGKHDYQDPEELAENNPKKPPYVLPHVQARAELYHIDCYLTGSNHYRFPEDLPPCHHEGIHLKIDGNLTLRPEAGETLELEGFYFIKDDFTVRPRPGGEVNLEGVFIVEGQVDIRGEVNRDTERPLAILAGENIRIFDINPGEPLLGGKLLLFTEKDLDLKHMGPEKIDIRGALISRRLSLSHCNLHYDPALIQRFGDYLPGYQVEIIEWLDN